jgi:hypothetical protein
MKTKGTSWKWAWCLSGAAVTWQFYFVRELIAALAFFAIGFAGLALVIVTLYMLQKGWEAAVVRFTNSEDLSGPGLQAGRPAREMP